MRTHVQATLSVLKFRLENEQKELLAQIEYVQKIMNDVARGMSVRCDSAYHGIYQTKAKIDVLEQAINDLNDAMEMDAEVDPAPNSSDWTKQANAVDPHTLLPGGKR